LVDEQHPATRGEAGEREADGAVAAPEVEALGILGHLDEVQEQAGAGVDLARGEEAPGGDEAEGLPAQRLGELDVAAQVVDGGGRGAGGGHGAGRGAGWGPNGPFAGGTSTPTAHS